MPLRRREEFTADQFLAGGHDVVVLQGGFVIHFSGSLTGPQAGNGGFVAEEIGGALDKIGEGSPCSSLGRGSAAHGADILTQHQNGFFVIIADIHDRVGYGVFGRNRLDGLGIGFDRGLLATEEAIADMDAVLGVHTSGIVSSPQCGSLIPRADGLLRAYE